jgi:hypothetical protein
MKNSKNIILAVFILIIMPHHYSYAGDAMGVKGAEKLGEVIKENMAGLNQVSADFGANFGKETVAMIGTAVAGAGATISAGGAEVIAAVKAAALAVAAAPATPYIVGGAVGVGGSYAVYRVFRTTPEDIARAEKYKADAEWHKLGAMEARNKQDVLKIATEFKQCFRDNKSAHLTPAGVPFPCADLAQTLAIIGGAQEVDKVVSAFQNHSY